MSDTAAVPEDRYVVNTYGPNDYKIFDRSYSRDNAHGWFSTWASAHELAQRLNREARAANKPAAEPAAPSCNCARYRHALEQIARYSGERPILLLANSALDEADKMKGDAS